MTYLLGEGSTKERVHAGKVQLVHRILAEQFYWVCSYVAW